ncbi:MAG: hypothetical protein LUE12_06635 [Ruminococcus sp.]|nr:hypothetical protein [Ruminococcus sp.]
MLWSRIAVVMAIQLVMSYLLGRIFIPIFRRLKTGRYEPYIGDRFKTDGSEPSFGGVCYWLVFALGAAAAASFCVSSQLFAAALYSLAVMAAGVLDDIMTDVQGKSYGVKSGAKLGFCYIASLIYIFVCLRSGWVDTAVMLPFRLGTIDFDMAFCPVTAAAMTVIIYGFRALNRFGTDDESCIGGLIQVVAFVSGLGIAVVGVVSENDTLLSYGYICAAAGLGAMVWGLSPSKQRSGSSGGFVIGALMAASLGFTSFYQLALVLLFLAAYVDGICSGIQYLWYLRTKKLLLKGSSFHMHLSAKGMSDYKVMIIFAAVSLAGAIATAAIVIYGQKTYF